MATPDEKTDAATALDATPTPPVARRALSRATPHGGARADEYAWLRRSADPEVLSYLEAENAYADALMRPTDALQRRLYEEMLARAEEQDSSAPYRLGDYLYYRRTSAGEQHPVYCRRPADAAGTEEVVLDPNALAACHDYLRVGAYEVSDDGRLLAYSVDTTGTGRCTLHVKDLTNGRPYPETFERVGAVVWAADGRTLFYTTEDESTRRARRLFRCAPGGGRSELVYDEGDESCELRLTRSRDREFIFVNSVGATSTEVRFIPSGRACDPPRLIRRREPGHQYYVHHSGGLFYIRTNLAAKNFRVVFAPVSARPGEGWTDLVPHRPEVKIEGVELFADYCVVTESEDGLRRLRVVDLRDRASHRLEFAEPVYSLGAAENREFRSDTFRFAYGSFVTPDSVIAYNMDTRERAVPKQARVHGYRASLYASERVFATAADGARVPVSLVYRRDRRRRGPRPLLLYGYGAYGVSAPVGFSAERLSLLDRGVVYAVAHVRGGGELGEAWHEAGSLLSKRNSLTDFISAAEHLIAEGYTAPDRLAVWGNSAGGLLAAAAINMRPELFKAAVLEVPFVDVLGSMTDPTLPLTVSDYPEWGDPREPRAYSYMRSYSPYDNIEAKAYPAMLVKAALNDSHVAYWGPAKYVARLRALKTDDCPLLLKVSMSAGHGGPAGLYDALRQTAFDYAFVLSQIGVAR
jgi:oligopeptidase B